MSIVKTLSNKKIITILTILVFAFLFVGILRFFNLYEGLNSLPDLYDTIDMKSDRIMKGQSLKPGSYITSQNGNYRLSFDMMGVLSVKKLTKDLNYKPQSGDFKDNNGLQQSEYIWKPIWNSGISESDTKTRKNLRFGPDGDLVLYDSLDNVLWNTQTSCMDGKMLIIHDDGDLIMYNSERNPIWRRITDNDVEHIMNVKVNPYTQDNLLPECKSIKEGFNIYAEDSRLSGNVFSDIYATNQNTTPPEQFDTSVLFQKERDVLEKLNTFNQEYSKFQRCNYYYLNCSKNNRGTYDSDTGFCKEMDTNANTCSKLTDGDAGDTIFKNTKTVSGDTKSGASTANLNITYTNLNQAIADYKGVLDKVPTPGPTQTIDEISEKHSNIQKLRNELDVKLGELNMIENSQAAFNKLHMDSTVYATLLWTALATSLLFFTFSKI